MSFILLVIEFYTVMSAQVKPATFGRISLRGRRGSRQLFCAGLPVPIPLKLLMLAPGSPSLEPYPEGHMPSLGALSGRCEGTKHSSPKLGMTATILHLLSQLRRRFGSGAEPLMRLKPAG